MSKIIDLHAHVVLEAGFGQAGKFGPELAKDNEGVPFFRIGQYQMKPMEYRGTVFMEIDQRLERMEQMGIDQQMLSPNPLTMFHHIPAETADHFCKIHNDAMAEIVAANPGRFFGAACLPMQSPDLAIKELERATSQLGLIAAYTGTDYPVTLDDPSLDEFYSALTALNIPLFMHPASSGGDAGPLDERLNRFNLSILLGYPYEELMTIASLIFGGVLDRHPDLDVCISHGGGGVAYFLDRFIGMTQFGAWVPDSIKEHGFQTLLNKLWFDAHVDGDAAHQRLTEVIDADRLVYGTNFGGWDTPSNADAFAASLTPNAEKLLRLERAA